MLQWTKRQGADMMQKSTISKIKTNFLAVTKAAGKFLVGAQTISMKLEPLRRFPIIGGTVADIQDLISMLNDYYGGRYKKIPFAVIIAAIGIGAYAASPLDIIPDEIPIIGEIDDLFVAKLLIDFCVDHELERYRTWKLESDDGTNSDLVDLTVTEEILT